jgi:two-component system chemotaxis response regulator CheB
MSANVRVLVVDDSVVVRRLVSQALTHDPGIEIAGVAANGRIALAKLDHVAPDIVTLDVEMPVMDGLETLRELRKRRPDLPVIMFSTVTERGATITLDALAAGADDYVTKPANVGSVVEGIRAVREQLTPKIRALTGRRGSVATPGVARMPAGSPARPPVPTPPAAPRSPAPSGRIDLVAIGASTGGPNALTTLIPALHADFPVPIVVVQHMPPMFTELLAQRLDRAGRLKVREGVDGAPLRPGEVWIAPGGRHMEVRRRATGAVLALHDGPPEQSCRPAADVLLRSVAEVHGASTLAVILTGMGEDGLRGSGAVAAAGGTVVAQDQATSVVWGMPGAVVRAGVAHAVQPLDGLAGWINARVRQHDRRPAGTTS